MEKSYISGRGDKETLIISVVEGLIVAIHFACFSLKYRQWFFRGNFYCPSPRKNIGGQNKNPPVSLKIPALYLEDKGSHFRWPPLLAFHWGLQCRELTFHGQSINRSSINQRLLIQTGLQEI